MSVRASQQLTEKSHHISVCAGWQATQRSSPCLHHSLFFPPNPPLHYLHFSWFAFPSGICKIAASYIPKHYTCTWNALSISSNSLNLMYTELSRLLYNKIILKCGALKWTCRALYEKIFCFVWCQGIQQMYTSWIVVKGMI